MADSKPKATNIYIEEDLHKDVKMQMLRDFGKVNVTALCRAAMEKYVAGELKLDNIEV